MRRSLCDRTLWAPAWICGHCGEDHPTRLCFTIRFKRNLPLETPSHNGPWQGRLPVRVVAPGVSGLDASPHSVWLRKAALGRHRRWQVQIAMRTKIR